MPVLKLARGVRLLFCPTLALPEHAFPFGPALTERAVGGVEKAKDEVRLVGGYAATAVIAGSAGDGSRVKAGAVESSSRMTARPMDASPIPAPDAQSCAKRVSLSFYLPVCTVAASTMSIHSSNGRCLQKGVVL